MAGDAYSTPSSSGGRAPANASIALTRNSKHRSGDTNYSGQNLLAVCDGFDLGGRLAATRWLIEFVGIKEKNGHPVRLKPKKQCPDVFIDALAGGKLFDPGLPAAETLARVWKGCSQASSHATTDTHKHPAVNEAALVPALTIITAYLQAGIYQAAGKNLRDYVLAPV